MKSIAEFLPMFITTSIFVYVADIYESIHSGIYFWMLLLFIFGSLAMQGMGHLLAIITNGNFFALITILPGWMTLLFLLSNCFDNVYCYKPIASKKGNSEIYIIGKGFHRQHYLLKWSDKLKIINQFPIGLQELISDIFNQSMIIDQTLIIDRKLIPNEFIEKICKIVTNFYKKTTLLHY